MTNRPQFPRKHAPPSADAIKQLRHSAGWSIAQAANMCSVNTSSWKKWEDGAAMPAPVWKLANMIAEQIRNGKIGF